MANANTSTVNISQFLGSSSVEASPEEVGPGDAVWILTSAFIIFTMISGFGLVESGAYAWHVFISNPALFHDRYTLFFIRIFDKNVELVNAKTFENMLRMYTKLKFIQGR